MDKTNFDSLHEAIKKYDKAWNNFQSSLSKLRATSKELKKARKQLEVK
jgi:prefoldin subunit 5